DYSEILTYIQTNVPAAAPPGKAKRHSNQAARGRRNIDAYYREKKQHAANDPGDLQAAKDMKNVRFLQTFGLSKNNAVCALTNQQKAKYRVLLAMAIIRNYDVAKLQAQDVILNTKTEAELRIELRHLLATGDQRISEDYPDQLVLKNFL